MSTTNNFKVNFMQTVTVTSAKLYSVFTDEVFPASTDTPYLQTVQRRGCWGGAEITDGVLTGDAAVRQKRLHVLFAPFELCRSNDLKQCPNGPKRTDRLINGLNSLPIERASKHYPQGLVLRPERNCN
jgi:hypothetical protein